MPNDEQKIAPNPESMKKRLGNYRYHRYQAGNPLLRPLTYVDYEKPKSVTNLKGIGDQRMRFRVNGGNLQQERMILDKRRSLDRALLYSYQGANIRRLNYEDDEPIVRALINPNKLKMDYDDKIVSIPFEFGFQSGDVFEWMGTNTHWLICLQHVEELAYFRGEIRKCSYEIAWEDEDGLHRTYAAVRGPVETKINYIQKHQISVDRPNFSLNIRIPKNEETLKQFKRYSKFYLQGQDPGSPQICWRVEAIDWISTPGILEINAVEYYANESEDDIEQGLVGTLITKPEDPNDDTARMIDGEVFIKPKQVYTYSFRGLNTSHWTIDTKKYPVEFEPNPKDNRQIHLQWTSPYSGEFVIQYGKATKTIVVESLF